MLSYKKDKKAKYVVSNIDIRKRGEEDKNLKKRELQPGEMEVGLIDPTYRNLGKYRVRAKDADVNELLDRLSSMGDIHDKIVFNNIGKKITIDVEGTIISLLREDVFGKLRPKIYNVISISPEWDRNKNLIKAGYYKVTRLSDAEIQKRREQAQLKNAEGERLMKQGRYTEALDKFGNAGDPDYIEPTINLGKIYLLNRNYSDAIEYFEKALDIDNNNPEAYLYLSEVYGNTDQIEKSLESMEKYIKLAKDDKKVKEISKQIKHLKDKSAKNYYSLTKEGDEYKNKKDIVKAKEAYKKAILVKPDIVSAYKKLGAIYEKDKDYKNAEKMYKKVIEKDSNNFKNYTELAQIYAESGRLKEAIEMLTQAAKICPVKNTVLQINQMIEAFKEGLKSGK